MLNTFFFIFHDSNTYFVDKRFSATNVNFADQPKETSESSVKLKKNIDFCEDDDEVSWTSAKAANFKKMLITDQVPHLDFDQDDGTEYLKTCRGSRFLS